MARRSFIRGYGLIGAQGTCASEVFEAIDRGAILDTNRGAPIEPNIEPRVTQLALHAAGEAIERAGWSKAEVSDPRTALVVGSSKGPVEAWVRQIESMHDLTPSPVYSRERDGVRAMRERPSPQPSPGVPGEGVVARNSVALSPLVGVGESAGRVGQMLAMRGPRLTYAAACASGLHALIQADLLIRSNQVDRALVVGCESSLHPIFVATFARMGALSKKGSCRPFDADRDGFLISEAAGAVCLEAGDADGICIDATSFAADAHHITAIDPRGESLQYVLSQLKPDRGADLVHAHGTGTELNDPIELASIEEWFGNGGPRVFSHKAAMGHTQGAAGMIGVVLNVMMHEQQRLLPIANLHTPLPTRDVVLARRSEDRRIRRSLVLAAGFGGATAGVALARVS